MAFTAKIFSWHFRHLNIVGCLLRRRPTKGGGGGSRAPQDPPSYAPVTHVQKWVNCLSCHMPASSDYLKSNHARKLPKKDIKLSTSHKTCFKVHKLLFQSYFYGYRPRKDTVFKTNVDKINTLIKTKNDKIDTLFKTKISKNIPWLAARRSPLSPYKGVTPTLTLTLRGLGLWPTRIYR